MSEAYGYTIFCDDIRQEVGGKISFMGTYIGSMNLGASAPATDGPPFILPKFAAAAHFIIPRGNAHPRLRVTLTMERERHPPLVMSEYTADIPAPPAPDHGDVSLLAWHFVMAPFAIPGDCILRVRGYLDDHEVKAGGLDIRFVPGLTV